MTLREQLRERAAVIEQRNSERNGRDSLDELVYRDQMLPVLRAALRYFSAIVEDLEIIQSTLRFTLPMGPHTAPEVKFRQSSYRISVDNDDWIKEITVSARCDLTAVLTRHIHDLRAADAYEEMLRERGLSFFRRRHEKMTGPDRETSHFTVEGSMSSGFALEADPENRRIRVRTHNLEDQPIRVHPLAPQRLNDELFESLGRLLLREQNQLLFTEVSDEVRQQLRERARSGKPWVSTIGHNGAQRTNGIAALKQSMALLTGRARRLVDRRRGN